MEDNNKKEIDVLMISDLHLGLNLSRTEELLGTIDKYKFKKLIINGDIFDSLDFNRLHSRHWDVLSRIRELSRNVEVVWINGNHDGTSVLLSQLIGVKVYTKYIWESNGKKFLAIHGHQFDRLMNKNIIIGTVAMFLYYFVQNVFKHDKAFTKWLKKSNKSWMRMSDQVAKGATLYGKLRKADYVFCGHTHIALYKKIRGVKYYNSGCWVDRPSAYITIRGIEIKIKRVD